jgi:hypothetical protein
MERPLEESGDLRSGDRVINREERTIGPRSGAPDRAFPVSRFPDSLSWDCEDGCSQAPEASRSPRGQPAGTVRASEQVLRLRTGKRSGIAHPELCGRRRSGLRMAPAAASPGVRRRLERRNLRRAARLPQQLGRGAPPSAEIRRGFAAMHGDGGFPRFLEAPDADGRCLEASRASRRVLGRSRDRRSNPGGERPDDRDLPGDFRRGLRGTPRVSPLVEGRCQVSGVRCQLSAVSL